MSEFVFESKLSELALDLKNNIEGEVFFDDIHKSLYATDSSPYEIQPYGVVIPKTIEDVSYVVKIAKNNKIPILARGGGTSLAGQTVAKAIVIDFSKYFTKILEFNEEERWVKVQTGVVRDSLNKYLSSYDLQFTPDVSTTNRANIGGMVANNAAGTRSIKYGKSVDQVIAMTVMLSDGSIVELKELDKEELNKKINEPSLDGRIHKTVKAIIDEDEDEIEKRYPKVMRRVGGYNLDEFTKGKAFNLAKLVSGSEGTLAIILDVTVKLFPIPKYKMITMLHFKSLHDALVSVQYINQHNPSAVEIMDDVLFDLARENPNLHEFMWWLEGNPPAVLLVEFDGETEAEMLSGFESLKKDKRVPSYHMTLAFKPEEQESILEFRRRGLGIYATVKGDEKPTPFIEDPAIPVEHLAEYLPEALELCKSYGVKAVIYGHASVGVVHFRPILNLKTQEGIDKFAKISQGAFELVKKYGGSWSGEHGDGLIRSYQNINLFGEKLYADFLKLKNAFDPDNILNPGKIVNAAPMTENLRYGPDYKTIEVNTYFDFSNDDGFAGAIEMCSGVGACRKTDSGTMCPSFIATRDEKHSTRGRANVLRDAISGQLPGGLTTQEIYDVLDLCLSCKACKSECPSQVDMAKIKYEFLQQYYDEHGTPLVAKMFGYIYKLAPIGRFMAPIANLILPTMPFRWLLNVLLKVDSRRIMPKYANQAFDQWVKKNKADLLEQIQDENSRTIGLYIDTWTMYYLPHLGKAAVKVLEAFDYRVEMIPYSCCGRPLISKGLLKDAQKQATKTRDLLHSYFDRGITVVGLEPSCMAALQDDYTDLIPGKETQEVAGNVLMIDQFLAAEWAKGKIDPKKVFDKSADPVLLHGNCHQKAIMGTAASQAVLEWVSPEVDNLDAGCCGMAGSFGYSHYDFSMKIGEDRLFPAAREHQGEIAAPGFSCRKQIEDGTEKHAKHIIEILADSLKPEFR